MDSPVLIDISPLALIFAPGEVGRMIRADGREQGGNTAKDGGKKLKGLYWVDSNRGTKRTALAFSGRKSTVFSSWEAI